MARIQNDSGPELLESDSSGLQAKNWPVAITKFYGLRLGALGGACILVLELVYVDRV